MDQSEQKTLSHQLPLIRPGELLWHLFGSSVCLHVEASDRYLMFYKVFIAIKHHNSAFLFIRLKVLRNVSIMLEMSSCLCVSVSMSLDGKSISFLYWSSVCVCVCLFLSELKWSSSVAECVIITD